MFRRFFGASGATRCGAIAHGAPRAPPILSSTITAVPALVGSASGAYTVEAMVGKLAAYQQEFAVTKSPVLKREAAELIEKEVLSDAGARPPAPEVAEASTCNTPSPCFFCFST